ncbi:Dehydrogenase [Lachnellula willkommii]|uniref:Dehydrogenase n=1 Tax=Lachnellula willkommii TaxID=215461 RepID=A0A559M9Q0_9HELO|nr:Dehydrogenase [Lachnellula willkommii]
MSTHPAVVTASVRGALQVIQVPTIAPCTGEVLVRVEWTASTPLNLHQNDGGLLVQHPQVLGGDIAGTVVEVGPGVERLEVGDKVFGFTWREQKEKAHQTLATVPEYLLGIIPPHIPMRAAATLPDNFVTVFHALTTDLHLPLPWPRPTTAPEHAHTPILLWGGASSVGQYALQILAYYGYRRLLTTASPHHHELLRSLGASAVFDYRAPDVVARILDAAAAADGDAGGDGGGGEAGVPFVLDCIGSLNGSLAPLAEIAGSGSTVAVLLPVIVRDATEGQAPLYSLDAGGAVAWKAGVEVRGVRTHFYLDNEFFKQKLQSEIMPTLLGQGIVKPNRFRVVEGSTLRERAQGAMDMLRRREASGERFVWRVSE